MIRKTPKCSKGFPCGKSCISRERLCWANLSSTNNRIAETFSQFLNRLVGISTPNQSIVNYDNNINTNFTEYEKSKIHVFKNGEATKKKINSLKNYIQDGYRIINSNLRSSKQLLENEIKEILELEEAYNSIKPIEENLITYRGTNLELNNLSVGSVFFDKGYSSTSKDKKIAKENFGGKFLLKYYLKGGTENAKDISSFGIFFEQEVLIRPNTKFLIKSIQKNENSNITYIELEEI